MEKNRRYRFLPVLFSLFTLYGCGSTLTGEPKFNTTILLPEYTAQDGKTLAHTASENNSVDPQPIPASCAQFDASPTVSNRNDCIRDLKTDIDDRFFTFRDGVQAGVDYTNLGLDLTSLGLSAAGAASGGTTAKTILAAINGGVTGAKTSINEDLLYKTSIALLLTQMESDRSEQFTRITQSMTSSLDGYPMSQARNDLLVYYADGTWAHAIMSLQSKTSANLAGCQAVEKATVTAASGMSQPNTTSGTNAAQNTATCNNTTTSISAAYNYGDAAKSLYSKWMPNGKTIDKTAQTKIQACMKKLGITTDPAYFIYTGSEDQKNQVLGCLAGSSS